MTQVRSLILKSADTNFSVATFCQAYSRALKEAELKNKKESGLDEIAPQLEKLIDLLLIAIDLTDEQQFNSFRSSSTTVKFLMVSKKRGEFLCL